MKKQWTNSTILLYMFATLYTLWLGIEWVLNNKKDIFIAILGATTFWFIVYQLMLQK